MRDLYTTAVRAKEMLRGEQPPLTPLTDAALEYVDPEYVPGMGILEEDETRGKLRCPMRGCGRWYVSLGAHMRAHAQELGCFPSEARHGRTLYPDPNDRFRSILSLDPECPLSASKYRAALSHKQSQTMKELNRRRCVEDALDLIEPNVTPQESALLDSVEHGSVHDWMPVAKGVLRAHGIGDAVLKRMSEDLAARRARAARSLVQKVEEDGDEAVRAAVQERHRRMTERKRRDRVLSAGFRNLLNLCDAQIAQRVLSVRDKVRRWPGVTDVAHHDPQLLGATALLELEWDHVLAWTRLKAGMSDDAAADARLLVRAWADINGRLPRPTDLGASGVTPLLPPKETLLAALGEKRWAAAMKKVRWVKGVSQVAQAGAA